MATVKDLLSNIIDKVHTKVDKIEGKGLSTNDYTTTEKNKIANLSNVALSGNYNDLTNKPAIPSINGLASETYVNNAVSGKADTAHTQSASTIATGTFPDEVSAGAQTPGTALLRNTKLVSTETTPTVNGEIYWQYE